jgi:signal peptidase I
MSKAVKRDQGFVGTWAAATFGPRDLFSLPAEKRSQLGPVSFAMIIALCVGVAGVVVGAILNRRSALETGGQAIVAIVAGPVGMVVSVYLSAVVTHFWVIVAGIKPRSFKETLSCVGYCSAPALFGVIPLLGGLVGAVWQVVILGIALKSAQRTTTGRAVFAAVAGTLGGPAGMILLALFLRAGVVEAFKMPSGSMIPSLVIGDHIFVSKLAYGPLLPWADARLFSRLPPARADVMVFKFPENKEQDFIKRVIALPGDTLEAINGRPVINGWLAPHCHVGQFHYENRTAELFVEYLGDRSYFTLFDVDPDEQRCGSNEECGAGLACRGGVCGILQGPFHVAPEEVWVMGDNRNNSHDSRSWYGGRGGGVPFENIKGRAMFVWMSFGLGGEIVQERLFQDIHGQPVLPRAQQATLGAALDKCLQERPPVAQTTPPGPLR